MNIPIRRRLRQESAFGITSTSWSCRRWCGRRPSGRLLCLPNGPCYRIFRLYLRSSISPGIFLSLPPPRAELVLAGRLSASSAISQIALEMWERQLQPEQGEITTLHNVFSHTLSRLYAHYVYQDKNQFLNSRKNIIWLINKLDYYYENFGTSTKTTMPPNHKNKEYSKAYLLIPPTTGNLTPVLTTTTW